MQRQHSLGLIADKEHKDDCWPFGLHDIPAGQPMGAASKRPRAC